jgi:hypothetical protein
MDYVSATHRPPLETRKFSVYVFCEIKLFSMKFMCRKDMILARLTPCFVYLNPNLGWKSLYCSFRYSRMTILTCCIDLHVNQK